MSNDTCPKPPVYCLGDSVFSVPQYSPYNSPYNLKFRKMFEHQQFYSIHKYLECPEYQKTRLFQIPDRGHKTPLFHQQAVLYLTPFALAVYTENLTVAKFIAELTDENGESLVDVNGVCYATNVCQRKGKYCDILILYPFCIAIRRELWDIIPYLLRYGWKPHKKIKLPSRTAYTCMNITYTDYLDYALGQLSSKPGLSLDKLINALYKTHHHNFDLRKLEYVPREEIPDNLCSIAKRMLRYSRFADKCFRNFSQILNAIRVLCNLKFFRGPVRSIFDVNLFQRLENFEPKRGLKQSQLMVYDQDSCIALLLGLIQTCIEKSLVNLERKAITILLQILLHTHWLYYYYIFEGPVLLYYFKHMEDITCDVNVFKSVRDTAITYTEVDFYQAEDLLYEFGANDMQELLIDMTNKSRDLEKRENEYYLGKITLKNLLDDAKGLSIKLENQRIAAVEASEQMLKQYCPIPTVKLDSPEIGIEKSNTDQRLKSHRSSMGKTEQLREYPDSATTSDRGIKSPSSATKRERLEAENQLSSDPMTSDQALRHYFSAATIEVEKVERKIDNVATVSSEKNRRFIDETTKTFSASHVDSEEGACYNHSSSAVRVHPLAVEKHEANVEKLMPEEIKQNQPKEAEKSEKDKVVKEESKEKVKPETEEKETKARAEKEMKEAKDTKLKKEVVIKSGQKQNRELLARRSTDTTDTSEGSTVSGSETSGSETSDSEFSEDDSDSEYETDTDDDSASTTSAEHALSAEREKKADSVKSNQEKTTSQNFQEEEELEEIVSLGTLSSPSMSSQSSCPGIMEIRSIPPDPSPPKKKKRGLLACFRKGRGSN